MSSQLDFQNSADIQPLADPVSAEVRQDDTPHIQPDAAINKPSVAVVVPDALTRKFGDIAQHVRTRLEDSLLRQAIGDWKTLQRKMVRSFVHKNPPHLHPQRFDLETFLNDALRIIGETLETHGVAHITAADATSAQVSLGFNPRAAVDLSTPRMLMKLLQILERIDQLMKESEPQRAVFRARLDGLEREQADLKAQLKLTPDGDHVNGPIRRELGLQISRLDAPIADVNASLERLDKRDLDHILAIGKILNVPYLPQELPAVVDGFINAVRAVPAVASKVSPRELAKLSGNPTLSFAVDLPKKAADLPPPQPSREVRLPPRAKVRKPSRPVPVSPPSSLPSEPLPKDVLYIDVPGIGRVRARVYDILPDTLQALAGSLKPGQIVLEIKFPKSSSESPIDAALKKARQYIHDNPGVYAQAYESQTGSPIRNGCVCTVEDKGDMFFAKFDDVLVGAFDLNGHPLSENDLRLYLIALKQRSRSTDPSPAT